MVHVQYSLSLHFFPPLSRVRFQSLLQVQDEDSATVATEGLFESDVPQTWCLEIAHAH